MMWCHLVLAMPIAGLGLFLFLPWPLALIIYLPIAAVSMLIYYKIAAALHLPVQTGRAGYIGAAGEVVGPVQPGGMATHLVRCRGEIWSVRAAEPLRAGDRVFITGFEGSWPRVQRASDFGGAPMTTAKCH